MSAALFGVQDGRARAFGRRILKTLTDRDGAAWRDVFPVLASVHARPFLGSHARISLPSEPLCDFEYHCPPTHPHPVLRPDAVPDGDLQDLEWLLTHLLLQTCHTQTRLYTQSFAYVWDDHLRRTPLAQTASVSSHFDRMSLALFRHSGGLPEEIWFLEAASHLHSYVPPEVVSELEMAERSGGLLTGLASQSEDTDLAADLLRLRHVLGLASANAEAIFLCYGVD